MILRCKSCARVAACPLEACTSSQVGSVQMDLPKHEEVGIALRRETKRAQFPAPVESEAVEARIHVVRSVRVMLDLDLAHLYGVTTSALNQAVDRNPARFPPDFAFRLTSAEAAILKSQIAGSGRQRNSALEDSGGGPVIEGLARPTVEAPRDRIQMCLAEM
jgi:hypothetical protein